MSRSLLLLSLLLLCGLVIACAGGLWEINPDIGHNGDGADEVSEYHPPKDAEKSGLTDDQLADKPVLPFDPTVVDSRPIDKHQLNASAAVIKLDVPLIKPDVDAKLLTLYPSYAAALAAVRGQGDDVLPSVNLLDGKVKQFDDGLYAALDRAYYRGLQDRLHGHVELVRRFYERIGKNGPAAAYLAAGLELAGVHVDAGDKAARDLWLRGFQENEVLCKPIGFYTWNKELATCFRFLRFFQQEFDKQDLTVPLALAGAMERDAGLRNDYQRMVSFYARLTNPRACRSLLDLTGPASPTHRDSVAFLPSSTSRETVLFEKLFPNGLTPDVDLMATFIKAIRSGQVSLEPTANSGWYEYQAFALETMLLPQRGQESPKLLLTKTYKERMLEAFKALITKRRETHVRQLDAACIPTSAPPPFMPPPKLQVRPRLRLEPAPTYYLRTARAYSFLANFLEASVGADGLRALHGLRQGGEREPDLWTELHWMRDLCYGLYLISAEDIGMKPALAKDELPNGERCYYLAAGWLPHAFEDRDLTADTRVSIPIAADPVRRATRLWATIGVRLSRLDAEYVRAPHVKGPGESGWQPVSSEDLLPSHYLIAVDDFVEVELQGLRTLTREELRAICDRGKTKEGILKLLRELR